MNEDGYDDIYGGSDNKGEGGAKKAADAGKKAADLAKKTKRAADLGKLFATPLGWIIMGIVIAILVLFLILGAISFLQTMPGLILGKIKTLATDAWDWIASEISAKDVEQSIKEENLLDIAQYVEDMGYDLYTTGFGKPKYDANDNKTIIEMDEEYYSPLYRYAYADIRTYTKRKEPNVILTGLTRGLNRLTRLALGGSIHGQGMLVMHDGLVSNTKVDPKAKVLKMKRYDGGLSLKWNEYTYSLDGWTGRYGMPLSFSLALHLSTMKPDLVTEIIDTFNTEVNIKQKKTEVNLSVFYRINGKNYNLDGAWPGDTVITEEIWNDIKNRTNDEINRTPRIYQPYITTVNNHWYYDYIIFDGYIDNDIKQDISNLEDEQLKDKINEGISGNYYSAYETSTEQEEGGSYIYKNSAGIIGEGNSGEIYITEVFPANIEKMVQVRQPLVSSGANEQIKKIFADKYYTYDGTTATADAIQEARNNKDDSLKKPVEFNKKDALEALTILENAKDLDSQYIYRDLKKLLIELEYFTEEDFATPDTLVLKWILSGYRPIKWPQRENEYSHGAILYSKSTEGHEEDGFDAEKSVTSPGKGIITKISEDSITIKFTEPEVVLDFSMKISGFEVNQDLKEGDEIEQGAEIGKTTDSNIKMILKDAKGSVIDYIEDYINPKKVAFDSEWAFLYWVPYESGGLDGEGRGPESVGSLSNDESAVGFAQWTTLRGGINHIEEFCRYAYEADPTLCAPLQQYIGMDSSSILNNIDNIRTSFRTICSNESNRDAFLQIQVAKFTEEFTAYLNAKEISWVADASSALQGTLASLWNWGSGLGWPERVTQSSDLQSIQQLLGHACTIGSTVSEPSDARWASQYVLTKDILEGVISEEKLEDWVRHGTIEKYQKGNNTGALDPYIN